MFHIKNDKRAIRSANLVQEGLARCLKYKSFDLITIADIQKESTVSRATFYRLFDNLTDVLSYRCELLAIEIEKQYIEASQRSKQSFISFSLSYWLKNHEFLEAVFVSGRMEILQNSLQKHGGYLVELFNLDSIPVQEMEYLFTSSTALISSVLMVWIKHGKVETSDELYQIALRIARLTSELLR